MKNFGGHSLVIVIAIICSICLLYESFKYTKNQNIFLSGINKKQPLYFNKKLSYYL